METSTSRSITRTIPAPALWLGLGGLVPFFGLAGWIWIADGIAKQGLVVALTAYAGVILAFMGGVHWGIAMRAERATAWGPMIVSVVPALIAWPAIVFLPPFGLGMMMAAFLLLLIYDVVLAGRGDLPTWYRHLRIVLTSGVELALAAGIWGYVTEAGPL